MTGIEAFCSCDCTKWVEVAFVIGALIGSLVIVTVDYLERVYAEE
jgi:hypothetical protein